MNSQRDFGRTLNDVDEYNNEISSDSGSEVFSDVEPEIRNAECDKFDT